MASVGRPPKGQAKRVDTNEITSPAPVGDQKIANAITGPKDVGDHAQVGNVITHDKES